MKIFGIRFIISIFIAAILLLFGCKKEQNPLIRTTEAYQSDGNIWSAATVLPDTGNSSHYVSLQDICVDEHNNIFVATDFAGIFRSTDNGLSWQQINTNLIQVDRKYYNTSSLVSLNNIVYTGNSNFEDSAGIYRITEAGTAWEKLVGFTGYSHIITLFVTKNGNIFAGCYQGMYRSTNNGSKWDSIGTVLNWNELGYAFRFTTDALGRLYVGTRKGIYISDDEGMNWLSFGLETENIFSVAVNIQGFIYASAEKGNIYRSTDNGLSWQIIFSNPDFVIKDILINSKNVIFIATTIGIYRSKDNGDHWNLIGLENIPIQRLKLNSKGYIVAGSFRNGVYLSTE